MSEPTQREREAAFLQRVRAEMASGFVQRHGSKPEILTNQYLRRTEMNGNIPEIGIVTISPEFAGELLARNGPNRNITVQKLKEWERALQKGQWKLNGEAIKLDRSGRVLDGQHRLTAIVNTGIPMETVLVTGLEEVAQATMDTGKSRTLGDILRIRGEVNSNPLAAALKRAIVVERASLSAAFSANLGKLPITNQECLDWLEENPWIRDFIAPGQRISRTTALSGSSATLLLWILEGLDEEDARYFFRRLSDGVNLSEDDPIWILRRSHAKVLAEQDSGRGGGRSQRYVAALTIKAWNAFREGAEIKSLTFRPGGANPEKFPRPV